MNNLSTVSAWLILVNAFIHNVPETGMTFADRRLSMTAHRLKFPFNLSPTHELPVCARYWVRSIFHLRVSWTLCIHTQSFLNSMYILLFINCQPDWLSTSFTAAVIWPRTIGLIRDWTRSMHFKQNLDRCCEHHACAGVYVRQVLWTSFKRYCSVFHRLRPNNSPQTKGKFRI